MSPRRSILPALLASAMIAGAVPAAAAPSSTPPVAFADQVVPYTDTRGEIIFDAVINGRKIAVLLDSGSGVSLLDAATAATLGVAAAGAGPELDTGEGGMASRVSAPVSLSLSNRTVIAVSPVQTDLAAASGLLGRKIDFVLGVDALRRAALFVFPGDKTLAFEPSGARPAGFHHVALSLTGRVATVPVRVDGRALKAVLDLGSSRMIVTPAVFAGLAPARVTDGATAGATGRISIVPVARLATLGIGDDRETGVPYQVSALPGEFAQAADVVIGAEELAPFDFGLDLAGGDLWLRPRSPPPASNIERAGLEIAPTGDAGVVLHVAKGSPAERDGWVAGERVCLIDGRSAAAASTDWKQRPEGVRVVLKMCDGKVRTMILHQFY